MQIWVGKPLKMTPTLTILGENLLKIYEKLERLLPPGPAPFSNDPDYHA